MNVTAGFTMGALPPSFNDTPQALANSIAAGLTVDLSLDSVVITGQVGGTEPVSNIGLWFPPVTGSSTSPSGVIYAWNATSAKYLPAPLVAGQLVGTTVFLSQIQSTATADRINKLPDKDGTIAFLDDISTGTGTKTFTGGAVTINWEDRKTAYITATGNVTIAMSGTPTDNQEQDFWIENNNSHSYTVTFPTEALWAGGTPYTQTVSGGATQRRIDHIILHNIGAGTGLLFAEVVDQDYQIDSSGDPSAPTMDSVTRYGSTITLTMSEPILGGTLNSAGFTVRTPTAGTSQTISAVTATGSVVRIAMAASMPATSEYTLQYSGSDIKNLNGVAAAAISETEIPYVNVSGTIGGSGGISGGHNVP